MNRVTSKDGMSIAYEREGTGPAVILVGGNHDDGSENAPLAAELAEHFALYNYVRRGRSDSGDTQPYAVERETEDIEALITKAGGSGYLYGVSSVVRLRWKPPRWATGPTWSRCTRCRTRWRTMPHSGGGRTSSNWRCCSPRIVALRRSHFSCGWRRPATRRPLRKDHPADFGFHGPNWPRLPCGRTATGLLRSCRRLDRGEHPASATSIHRRPDTRGRSESVSAGARTVLRTMTASSPRATSPSSPSDLAFQDP